jgi:hypothetical protein
MDSYWELTRVKRQWVPEWLWAALRILPVRHWPLRQLLTREATQFEKMRAAGYNRHRTVFEIQMWGDDDNG